MACLALIASFSWLSFVAGLIIDTINFYSIAFSINKTILSCTFLALGNSLADYFANGSLARLGYAVMACTGTVAGQVFNTTLGLGLSLLRKSVKAPIPFDLLNLKGDHFDAAGGYCFFVMVASLLVYAYLLIFSCSTQFELGKGFAKSLYVVYAFVLVLLLVVGVYFLE